MLEALGKRFPDGRLTVDPNGAWSLEEVVRLLTPLRPVLAYAEDPVSAEGDYSSREVMAEFRRRATDMVATDWRQLGHAWPVHAVDIPLADVHCWTMTGSVQVAELCAAWGYRWGLHSNNHFNVSLAMSVQAALAAPGDINPIDTHWIWQEGEHLTIARPQIVDGFIANPDLPGLGIELDGAAHALYRQDHITTRDDAAQMRHLIPGWCFDPRRPAMAR